MAKLITLKNTEGDALIAKGVISINNTAEEIEALGGMEYVIENYLASFNINIGVTGKNMITPFVNLSDYCGHSFSQILLDVANVKTQAILGIYINWGDYVFTIEGATLFSLDGTELEKFPFTDSDDILTEYPLNYSITQVQLLPRMVLNV